MHEVLKPTDIGIKLFEKLEIYTGAGFIFLCEWFNCAFRLSGHRASRADPHSFPSKSRSQHPIAPALNLYIWPFLSRRLFWMLPLQSSPSLKRRNWANLSSPIPIHLCSMHILNLTSCSHSQGNKTELFLKISCLCLSLSLPSPTEEPWRFSAQRLQKQRKKLIWKLLISNALWAESVANALGIHIFCCATLTESTISR